MQINIIIIKYQYHLFFLFIYDLFMHIFFFFCFYFDQDHFHLKYDFYAIEIPKGATKANLIVEQTVQYEMTIKYVADHDTFKSIIQKYYPSPNPHQQTYDHTVDGLIISQHFGDRALKQHNYIYIGNVPFMD